MNRYLDRNHILNMYICKYMANIIHYIYNMCIYIKASLTKQDLCYVEPGP